jgi:hypothetical protein
LIALRPLSSLGWQGICKRGDVMALLIVFLISLVIGQAVSIAIGLTVERYTSSYTGLVTFICCYFATFWVAWRSAVRITQPGTRLGRFLRVAEK